jgi:hypothetical protein
MVWAKFCPPHKMYVEPLTPVSYLKCDLGVRVFAEAIKSKDHTGGPQSDMLGILTRRQI